MVFITKKINNDNVIIFENNIVSKETLHILHMALN